MGATVTLLDLAKRKIADTEVGLISETMKAVPEISGINLLTGQPVNNLGAAKTIRGTVYNTRVRTALPSVGFRNINEGTQTTKQTTENRMVTCHLMNPRWQADYGISGFDANLLEELAENAAAHLEAGFQLLGKAHFYGQNTTFGAGAKGFPGLLEATTAAMTVDAGGTTDNTASSVYAVSYGIQGVRWVLGNDGQFEITDPRKQDALDSSNNPYTVLMQELFAHVGLQVGSTQAVGRIKKLTADSGKGLTTARLRSLYECFANVGKRPDAFFMSQRSYDQYEAHLESLSIVPSEATKLAFRGVPFVVTNSISNIETLAL
jgi:hypothetical protein